PRQRAVVASGKVGRLGRLLRAPVRGAAGGVDGGLSAMRVAVTGAGGRRGRALVEALENAPFTGLSGPVAWRRSDFDLDEPNATQGLLDRDPAGECVEHAFGNDR